MLEIVNMMDIKEHCNYGPQIFLYKIGSGVSVNEQLAEELHKPVIKTFK